MYHGTRDYSSGERESGQGGAAAGRERQRAQEPVRWQAGRGDVGISSSVEQGSCTLCRLVARGTNNAGRVTLSAARHNS